MAVIATKVISGHYSQGKAAIKPNSRLGGLNYNPAFLGIVNTLVLQI
jgi:hypothetical protein